MSESNKAAGEGNGGLFGQIRGKLVETKQKWAREGRLLTGLPRSGARAGRSGDERLPPGQRLVRDWPVLDLGIQPLVHPADAGLVVDGLVERPLDLDWPGFLALPQVEEVSDIHCVTAWSRYDNHWQGVRAQSLLDLVRPLAEARFVVFHSHDGYTANVTLEMFAAPDVLLAHSWEGAPLKREHGGPLRIIMPQYYLWKSAKWLKRIEFLKDDQPGFWEVRGYHNVGDPWREQRYG